MWSLVLASALGHEYQIHTLEPRDDWCAELHRLARPGDVIELSAGHYPGGCHVTVGGLVSHNEALVIASFESAVTIGADTNGVSLGIHGETTRVYGLELQGRLIIGERGASVDYSRVAELEVQPDVDKLIVLFSQFDDLELHVDDLVFRGNQVRDLALFGTSGLVADNTIEGNATTDLPFQRNLVTGDLDAIDAFANVVVGTTHVSGRLWGNTLLGPAQAADSRNNLSTVEELGAEQGNLFCTDCLLDAEGLDVRPTGAALDAPRVEATDDRFDFCRQPRAYVGAMGTFVPSDLPWTARDRNREGCGSDVYQPRVTIDVPPQDDPPESRGCATSPAHSFLKGFLRWPSR